MTFRVRRGGFAIEEPWTAPADAERLVLCRATDGSVPRLATTVIAWADAHCLDVLFQADDDEIVATHLRHDAALYDEDVVEVFLAPREPTRYFEIEVNPLGTTFDARVESPDGVRSTMHVDRSWTCDGLFAAIRRVPRFAETIIRIPFASLGVTRPIAGESWRANFFRIDRSASRGDEFSAWMPPLKTPADFHVVAAFGELVFE